MVKEAILPAIRVLPAGAQPSLSSSAYSRAALINHHATDGIDFNLLPSLSLYLQPFFNHPPQPYMSFSTFFLQSLSPIALPLPLILCSLSLSSLPCASLLHTSHIIELEQCQTPAPLVCLYNPKPLASPAQYLISDRICGEPLRINESDMRLISAMTEEIGFSSSICIYACVYL